MKKIKPQALGSLVLRLALGVMFLAHAGQKFFVFTLPGTAAFFASLGLPGFLAYPVFAAELLGGIALLLGFRTRLVAAALLPVLIGASGAHLGNGWAFTSPHGGWEYPVFLALTDLVLVLIGGGAFALTPSRDED